MSARRLLEAIYEPDFSDNSMGYRPNRGAREASRKLRAAPPVVGTHSGIRPQAIVQAYSFGAASCLLAYCSLRIKMTLLGVVVLFWSDIMFYPMLALALKMWDPL